MKKILKSIISAILVVSMLICSALPVFAAKDEEYICDLRIVYADDYEEAREILDESEFSDYRLFDENLNDGTGEDGAWLAYKVTTDIEDAITDMAVMTMNGGYQAGNYQEMIKQSYDEYLEMGGVYLDAVNYFIEAYEAGHYLAKSAFRQLNFYAIEDDYEGEKLGDIFFDGVDESELATMFMEGNSYALKNIRSLIAMGVSYNADGKTYLQKVADEAAKYNADKTVYKNEDYDELAQMIAETIPSIVVLLKDLDGAEAELDYTAEEYTDAEMYYSEAKFVADSLREVDYLGEQTLYEFMMGYKVNKKDYSSLYPLVAALNEGQIAMTKVAHYYDAIRYSMSKFPEEVLDTLLDEAEETYGESPFDLYTGVDRSVYEGSFALTTAAYRENAYSELNKLDDYFNFSGARVDAVEIGIAGVLGGILFASGCMFRHDEILSFQSKYEWMINSYPRHVETKIAEVAGAWGPSGYTNLEYVENLYAAYYPQGSATTFAEKLGVLQGSSDKLLTVQADNINNIAMQTAKAKSSVLPASSSTPIGFASSVFMLAGGALMVYSAVRLGMTIYNYYNPEYTDIPVSLVDLVETVDGDRYIKYDVVYEAESREEDEYCPADLNVFEAKAWNALYFTKSYEAGQPLLADEFSLSNTSNKSKSGFLAVHAFGESVCYNLNRYNFDEDVSIYLSVKQSKNQKSAVADVPEVIGSMFGAGFLFLAGGIGAAIGVGGTLGTIGITKKSKKTKAQDEA